MSAPSKVSRREFLETTAAAGAGLVIGFHLPPGGRFAAAAAAPFAPNAWLRISPDNSVLIVVDRSEMGQGVTTALPMLVAEELDADWTKVKIEFAPADKAYTNPMFGMQGTGGSTSVRAAYTPLRKAGAAAREMLVAAACQTWAVDRVDCRTEGGAVIHTGSKRRLTYGQLAAKAASLPVPENPTLKEPKNWKILGTRVKRLDTPAKVDGSAQFGIDVKEPGMLVAVVARCPTIGGKVASFDATKAKAVPGVKDVVQISSGVAVVADGYWNAKKGRDALDVKWDEGPNAQVTSASISQLLTDAAAKPSPQARHDGDPDGALAGAASKVEAAYELPLLAHATMEPMNCTAHVRADGVNIWAPTQFQTGAQGLGAKIGGVPPEKVQVHTTYLGGGFGRRFELDFIQEALETSKAAGAPVKVVWSREDDMQHDQYRPASVHQFRAGLDASGQPVAWTHAFAAPSIVVRVFGPGAIKNGIDEETVEGAVGMPYSVPNVHVQYALTDLGIPVGFWRSVNNTFNAFVVESFIDERAHAAPGGPVARDRGVEIVRQLRGRGRRDLPAVRWHAAGAPRGVRRGLRAGGEPQHRRSPDGERHRVRAHGGAVGRDHDRQGSGAAEQFPQLPDAAAGRDAEGRGAHRAVDRFAGRRGRARDAPDRASGRERDLRPERKADQEAADRKTGVVLTP